MQSIADGKPACKKLLQLPKIKKAMKMKDMVGLLMDNDILGVLKSYIMPVDDNGTLPALNIRTAILDLLLTPEVAQITEVWQLEKAAIGAEVYRLKDHPQETKQNRRKASQIVERWYRMLTGTSDNMKDISRMEEEKANHLPPVQKKAKKAPAASETDVNQRNQAAAGSWMQVRIPFPENNNFTRRPKTAAEVEIKALANIKTKKEEEKGRLDRMRDKTKKGGKGKRGNVRAEEVSIEGRGMEKYI
jgi:hypothetical protein